MADSKQVVTPKLLAQIQAHEAKVALMVELEDQPGIKALQKETPIDGTSYIFCYYNVGSKIKGLSDPKITEVLWNTDRQKVVEGMLNGFYAHALADCYPLGEPIKVYNVDQVIARAESQGKAYSPAKRKALIGIKRWVADMRNPHEDGLDAGDIWDAAKGSGLQKIFDIGDCDSDIASINSTLAMQFGLEIKDVHEPPSLDDLRRVCD